MASSGLALPPGATASSGPTEKKLLPMAFLLLAASGTMLFGALIGVYMHLRRITEPWPPEGVRIDDYIGNVLVVTMIMGSATAEWAFYALRKGERRQASAALGLTIGLGLAFLNLLSYGAGRSRFNATSHPYGVVVAAMTVLLAIVVFVGVAYVAMTLLRVAGGQVSAAEPDQLRATAWYWHFAVAVSLAVWYIITVVE